MLLVGITGGLASGKTTVARLFEECGAKIIDADVLARQVVQPRKAAWKEIARTFGKEVLTKNGNLDRGALAEMVFHDPAKLKQLTNIIHPRVAIKQAQIVKQFSAQDPSAVVVYDAAMLIEAGAHRRMDRVVVVKADRATQLARACRRDGLTKAEAILRLRNQMPLRRKLQFATDVLDGTLPLNRLRYVVRDLYSEFRKRARIGRVAKGRLALKT